MKPKANRGVFTNDSQNTGFFSKFRNYHIWFLFLATFIFFYSISPLNQDAGLFHVLLKTGSLNSYLFYAWKEPFFLDFDFHGIHPYYLLFSILGKFFSANAILISAFACFFGLFYLTIRYKILNFYTYILWLILCVFLFKYNATIFLLWFQYALYFIFNKKLNEKSKSSAKSKLFKETFFYMALSLIFLPGIVMIFFYHFLSHLKKSSTEKNFYRTIGAPVKPFILSFFLLLLIHLTLAAALFGVSISNFMRYLGLPFTVHHFKNAADNVSFAGAVINNLNANLIVYVVLFCAIFIWAFLIKDKNTWVKSILIFLWLVFGIFLTSAESVFFPLAGYFLLNERNLPEDIGFRGKIFTLCAVLLILLLSLLRSVKIQEEKADAANERIVVSFADLQKINFEKYFSDEKIEKIIVIDLKIIPENVTKLISEIKAGKIDVMLNDRAMAFLEKDSAYEKKVLEQLALDLSSGKSWSIYLKSSIHPDQEKWPWRRAYTMWKLIKKHDPGARIVLF